MGKVCGITREVKNMSKSLQFKVEFFRHKWPLLAVGFVGAGNEFVISLWVIDFRLTWGY